MPKLSTLLAATASTTLDVEGEPLTVTFRPGAYTARFLEESDEMTVPQALLKLIVSWDLLGDDGEPYPLTEASLQDLPLAFLRQVWKAISGELSPNPAAATNSESG